MSKTDILTIPDGDPDSTGDQIELIARPQALVLTIENPWSGDSESGFGASTSLALTPTQAREMVAWITEKLAVLDQPEPPPKPQPISFGYHAVMTAVSIGPMYKPFVWPVDDER